MKLTKSKLKQIIKEELSLMREDDKETRLGSQRATPSEVYKVLRDTIAQRIKGQGEEEGDLSPIELGVFQRIIDKLLQVAELPGNKLVQGEVLVKLRLLDKELTDMITKVKTGKTGSKLPTKGVDPGPPPEVKRPTRVARPAPSPPSFAPGEGGGRQFE